METWTIDVRTWIGASQHGLIVAQGPKGRGQWKRAGELPEYVRRFLHAEEFCHHTVMPNFKTVAELRERADPSRCLAAAIWPDEIVFVQLPKFQSDRRENPLQD